MKDFNGAVTVLAICLAESLAEPIPALIRSPCPLLNSLANHGFLPHNGKNITMPLIIDSFKKAINVGEDFAIKSGTPALALSGPGTYFDLDMLDAHNSIEHDGSLSRLDAYFGNDQPLSLPTFEAFFARVNATAYISIPTASRARAAHVFEKSKNNPTYTINQKFLGASLTQTALYLSVFGDPKVGNTDSNWVELFFNTFQELGNASKLLTFAAEMERFPVSDGWQPTVDETNATTLTIMSTALNASSSPAGVPLTFGPQ